MSERYGKCKCIYCGQIFFDKKKLDGHIGGAHRANITKTKKPKCKFCNDNLIEKKNWAIWAIKQRNLICNKCKNMQNRVSYRNRLKRRKEKI